MKLIDPSHPFFRPAWRRYAIVTLTFFWAAFEYANDNAIWAYLFAAIGGVLVWTLIVTYPPGDRDD